MACDQDSVAGEDFVELLRLPGCITMDQDIVAGEDFDTDIVVDHGHALPRAPRVVDTTPSLAVVQRVKRDVTSQRVIRRQKQVIANLRAQLKVSHGPGCRNRSKRDTRSHTMFSLALRRNRGHSGGAAALGMCLFDRATKDTLFRWEIAAGTRILSSFLLFHTLFENIVVRQTHSEPDSDCRGNFRCAFHSLRGDATRSRAWQEHKVQCLQLVTSYLSSSGDVVSRGSWLDLQKVIDGSASGCFETMRKQIRVVGCPALDIDHCAPADDAQVLRFVTCIGDCGPDQVGVRDKLVLMYAKCLYVLVTVGPCFLHQQSLGVKRVLLTIDALTKKGGSVRARSSLLFYCGEADECLAHENR